MNDRRTISHRETIETVCRIIPGLATRDIIDAVEASWIEACQSRPDHSRQARDRLSTEFPPNVRLHKERRIIRLDFHNGKTTAHNIRIEYALIVGPGYRTPVPHRQRFRYTRHILHRSDGSLDGVFWRCITRRSECSGHCRYDENDYCSGYKHFLSGQLTY